MKTRYKYIHFEYAPDLFKSESWLCRNNRSKALLGIIKYYGEWSQYTINFLEGCIFNNQCLRDIADFLDQLNKEPSNG